MTGPITLVAIIAAGCLCLALAAITGDYAIDVVLARWRRCRVCWRYGRRGCDRHRCPDCGRTHRPRCEPDCD